jgi:hypothetical protein
VAAPIWAGTVDDDLETLDRDALIEEVKRPRAGIRDHRDGTGHELCWHHPKLWGLLPEKSLDRQLSAARRSDDEA